jgi:catechol 2,3-dioxygenase-like lactoylglutathione lyase family enzyme
VFDHVTIRVSDLEASKRFYGLLFAAVERPEPNELSIAQASAERPVTRRLHLGFVAPSRAHVDAFWRKATAAGYRDDGEPGLRPQYKEDYYGAFVLDPDGNSAEAVHHGLVAVRTGVIDHLWLRVRDLAASRRFYEAVGRAVGFGVAGEREDRVGFGGEAGSFTLTEGEPTEHVELAFPVAEHAAVEELGAFVLDPDGNRVEAVVRGRRT